MASSRTVFHEGSGQARGTLTHRPGVERESGQCYSSRGSHYRLDASGRGQKEIAPCALGTTGPGIAVALILSGEQACGTSCSRDAPRACPRERRTRQAGTGHAGYRCGMTGPHATEARRLDLSEPDTLRRLWDLQRASYAVEAKLIGFDGIPALHESLEELRDCEESFLGLDDETGLAGAVSWGPAPGRHPGHLPAGWCTPARTGLESPPRCSTPWTAPNRRGEPWYQREPPTIPPLAFTSGGDSHPPARA